jgi:hypothetical protein
MTDQEKQIREKIAQEVATKFGLLAPYKMVCRFIRKGTDT